MEKPNSCLIKWTCLDHKSSQPGGRTHAHRGHMPRAPWAPVPERQGQGGWFCVHTWSSVPAPASHSGHLDWSLHWEGETYHPQLGPSLFRVPLPMCGTKQPTRLWRGQQGPPTDWEEPGDLCAWGARWGAGGPAGVGCQCCSLPPRSTGGPRGGPTLCRDARPTLQCASPRGPERRPPTPLPPRL